MTETKGIAVPVGCPRCPTGVVRPRLVTWTGALGPQRSVWADEPLVCSQGCVLTPAQVRRVLVAADRARAVQLPLFGAPEEDVACDG